MTNIDINRIQQNIEQLQDQNAIDFQQWKRLGQEIEKLEGKIKTSDCNLNLLIKKIKADYEGLRRIIIDENIQLQLNNKIEQNKNEINKKVNIETFQNEVNEINSQLDTIVKHSTRVINLVEKYDLIGDFDDTLKTGTDNYINFQKAIDECYLNGGGNLYLPKGNYKISESLVWKTNVSLIGDGMLSSIIYIVNSNRGKSCITYDVNYTTMQNGIYENCNFRDFGINGINVNTTGKFHVGDKAIFIQKMRNCTFTRLYLCDTGATALGVDFLDKVVIDNIMVERAGRLASLSDIGASGIGIGTNGLLEENFIITNCICNNCGKYGIFVEGQFNDGLGLEGHNSKGMIVANNITRKNRHGLGILGCNYVTLSNNISYENEYHGLKIYNSNYLKINDNILNENGYHGISMDELGCKEIDINGNTISKNKRNGISIDTSSKKFEKIILSNNTINENEYNGIFVGGSGNLAYLTIKNNSILSNGIGSSSINSVGIYIDKSVTLYNITINRNDITNIDVSCQRYGIVIKPSFNKLILLSNNLEGNLQGSLLIEGTITTLIKKGNIPLALNEEIKEITTLNDYNVTNETMLIFKGDSEEAVETLQGGYNGQEITIIIANGSLSFKQTGNIKYKEILNLTQYQTVKLKKYNINWFIVGFN